MPLILTLGAWCEREILHLDMSRGLHPWLLLEDCRLCLPCHISNHWNNAGVSDQKGASSRAEGLKGDCCHHLHLQHNHRCDGPIDLCTGQLHQCWHGNICGWNLLADYYFSYPDIYSKSKEKLIII